MKLRCDYNYCIYNKNLACLLDEIEISADGQCRECIIVSLPADKLEKYKKKHLSEIVNRC